MDTTRLTLTPEQEASVLDAVEAPEAQAAELLSSFSGQATSPFRRLETIVHASGPATKFTLLQHWEGVVLTMSDDSIEVSLRDLTDLENGKEIAELFLEDIALADRKLVEPGAVFYWSIGYEDTERGREKKSFIQFRRLPSWTKRDVDRIEAEASDLANYFGAASASRSSG